MNYTEIFSGQNVLDVTYVKNAITTHLTPMSTINSIDWEKLGFKMDIEECDHISFMYKDLFYEVYDNREFGGTIDIFPQAHIKIECPYTEVTNGELTDITLKGKFFNEIHWGDYDVDAMNVSTMNFECCSNFWNDDEDIHIVINRSMLERCLGGCPKRNFGDWDCEIPNIGHTIEFFLYRTCDHTKVGYVYKTKGK